MTYRHHNFVRPAAHHHNVMRHSRDNLGGMLQRQTLGAANIMLGTAMLGVTAGLANKAFK